MSNSTATILHPQQDATWHAERIRTAWGGGVESVLATGNALIEAKRALPHGEFGRMVAETLPFTASTAQRLMGIASDGRISNAAHGQHLPPSWRTLYELTHLDDATFNAAVESGAITPTMERRDAVALRKQAADAARENIVDHDEQWGPRGEMSFVDFAHIVESGRRYRCIYADPAWSYGNQATRSATDTQYGTMSIDEICALPVAAIADDDAHLHLWATVPLLPEAFRVIEAWGFEYRSCLVWDKRKFGIGNYWRIQTEFLLLGIRGDAKHFEAHDMPNIAYVDRTKHSKKPEEIREQVMRASKGPYIELFARMRALGWDAWGNEIERTMFDA